MTPALARERARMGALRGRTMGACLCQRRPQARSMGAIGALPTFPASVTTSEYTSALQAQVSAQASSIQQTLAAQTGVDTQNATVAQGASSAASLLQNGFNPQSASDNANLVHVIAGGLCLIPGVGPLLGGALEALWQVGSVIACPVTNAFASIGLGTPCNAPPCRTTGNFTTAQMLEGAPPMPRGSFASLAIPALASAAAQAANCKQVAPAAVIVDAVVNVWNKTHLGPAVPYVVPALQTIGGYLYGGDFIGGMNEGPNANVTYAFQPALAAAAARVLTQSGNTIALFGPPAPLPGYTLSPPRLVMVNAGALIPPITPHTLTLHLGPPPPPAAHPVTLTLHLGPRPSTAASARAPAHAGMSTGGKVAAGVATAGGAALLWWLGSHRWRWVTPRWAGKLVR